MARSLPVENLLPKNVGSIINYLQQSTKVAEWGTQAVVDHNQQLRMASETVNPIDWSRPQPSWAVPLERLVHSVNRCNLSSTGNRSCNSGMRGNHLAYVATQGVKYNTVSL